MEREIEQKKARLRDHYLEKRRAVDPARRAVMSRQILDHLTSWKVYRDAETVHCFMSLERNAEVETTPIFERMKMDGKRVVIPKSVPGTRRMEHYHYENSDSLEKSPLGIPEPVNGEKIEPGELDLILVPLLAADGRKHRLGYGLGYYDRFLSETDAIKAGLLFSLSMSEENLPVSEFDIRLDYLISETGIIE